MRKKTKILSFLLAGSISINCTILSVLINKKKNEMNNKINTYETTSKVNNDEAIFVTPDYILDMQKETTIPTIEPTTITIETTIPTIETTTPIESLSDENVITGKKGTIINNTSLYLDNNEKALIISNLEINDNAIRLAQCNNGFILIKCNENIGYIHESDIEYNNETIEIENHILKKDIIITKSNLNFRKSNNTESEIIKTFDEGEELISLGETSNGWLIVKNNEDIGYVKKDYTVSLLEKLKISYPNFEDKELTIKKIVYATSNLNIRTDASSESNKIDMLDKYESVRVIDEYGDWYLIITYDQEFGFINKNYTKELNDIFITIDLNKQRMYLYNDNNLYYKTKVTTGKDKTPSDIGLFKIFYKSRNCYITDTAYVKYWMNYNNGEGIHDSSWRSVYGKNNYHYNGSHGCINTPLEMAEKFYEKAEVKTKVLVHK